MVQSATKWIYLPLLFLASTILPGSPPWVSPSPLMSLLRTFSGTYKNRLDAKGRVSLPAEFRQALVQNCDHDHKAAPPQGDDGENTEGHYEKAVYAFPSPRGNRLEALCPAHFHSICATIETTTAMFSDDEDNLMAQIVAAARRLAFDNNGRILLPKDFLDTLDLREVAVFVGFARRFVIFSEKSFERWYKERTKHSLAPFASPPPPS